MWLERMEIVVVNLHSSVLSNFRPISKLPFLSKVLEKAVYIQLQSYLDLNGISESLVSIDNTETAPLRVSNDLLLAVGAGSSAVHVLLDLTVAFLCHSLNYV